MNTWGKIDLTRYHRMIDLHSHLWSFIGDFITSNNIQSAFEVGGGFFSPVKELVKDYINIDVNEDTKDAVHEDFTTMDLTPYMDKHYDLFIAPGVIEHCKNHTDLFDQMAKLNFRYAIVTFFHGLNRRRTMLGTTKLLRDENRTINFNYYTKKSVEKHLNSLGYEGKYEFFLEKPESRNTLVLIKQTAPEKQTEA